MRHSLELVDAIDVDSNKNKKDFLRGGGEVVRVDGPEGTHPVEMT